MASAFLVATAEEEGQYCMWVFGGLWKGEGCGGRYFDARFLTIIAVLLVVSIAQEDLDWERDLGALHTAERMLMVWRAWFNVVVSRAIH